jgi:4-amino-4-deoxy-L-arabinose transferase-like glycosyltransferase
MDERARDRQPVAGALTFAAWAAILLFYIAVRAPLLPVPLDRDEGSYAYAGQALLRGEMPYRDFYDHKPPGLFAVFALAALIFPSTAAGVHAFLHLWMLPALLAVAFLARRIAGGAAALWAAGIFAVAGAAPSVQGFTASSELLGLVPLAVSLAGAAHASGRSGRARDWLMIAAGLLAAFAFLIKPPLALPLLATPLLLRAGGGMRWTRDTAMWILGGAIAGALAAIVFAPVWSEFWYWNATHNSVYGEQSWFRVGERLKQALRMLAPDLVLPLLLAVAGCVWAARTRHRYALFLAVFLLLSVVSCFQTGFFYQHYFAQVLVALALAAGAGAAAVVRGRRATGLAVAVLVVILPVAARPWYWITPDPVEVSLRILGRQGFEASPHLAAHLRERTRPGDTIWIFGNEPQILFLADRQSATPFLAMYPMMYAFPRQREFQRVSWAAVQAANPAYIVVSLRRPMMSRPREMDSFIWERLESMKTRYAIESCLTVAGTGRLAFLTRLDAARRPCPGQPLFELWRRV